MSEEGIVGLIIYIITIAIVLSPIAKEEMDGCTLALFRIFMVVFGAPLNSIIWTKILFSNFGIILILLFIVGIIVWTLYVFWDNILSFFVSFIALIFHLVYNLVESAGYLSKKTGIFLFSTATLATGKVLLKIKRSNKIRKKRAKERIRTDKAFAIDFGTSRTKVSWRDTKGNIQILRFGKLDYLPSAFYMSAENTLKIGTKAEEKHLENPAAFIEHLKRNIHRDEIRTPNGSIKPEDILEQLFRFIRESAIKNINFFKRRGLPDEATLTLPANADWILTGKIKSAAMKAGFAKTNEEYEPISAARAWFTHKSKKIKPLIVLDCGGGTTDWVCIEPWEKKMRLSPNHPPNAVNLGGVDVDEALLQALILQTPKVFYNIEDKQLSILKKKITLWKEQVLKGESAAPIRLDGEIVEINLVLFRQVYKEYYLQPLYSKFETYVSAVKEDYDNIELLIVGGGANSILCNYFENLNIPVNTWERHNIATAIGALSIYKKTRFLDEENRDKTNKLSRFFYTWKVLKEKRKST